MAAADRLDGASACNAIVLVNSADIALPFIIIVFIS